MSDNEMEGGTQPLEDQDSEVKKEQAPGGVR